MWFDSQARNVDCHLAFNFHELKSNGILGASFMIAARIHKVDYKQYGTDHGFLVYNGEFKLQVHQLR